jgi:hypothetical protein
VKEKPINVAFPAFDGSSLPGVDERMLLACVDK